MTEATTVYVVADTHLGLRARFHGEERDRPRYLGALLRWLGLRKEDTDEPARLGGFIRWLAVTARESVEIPVLARDRVERRRLRPASHLILLGDIIELWDAENQDVLLSTIPVAETLCLVKAEKTYVLGNHDNILASSEGSYPFGDPDLKIVRDTYPEADGEGRLCPLRIGDRSYLFVHGHQFDRHFLRAEKLWKVLPYVRQFGAALGSYSWLLFLWWLIALAGLFVEATFWAWFLAAGLPILWVPRAYMTVARRAWKRFAGTRFDRAAALRGVGVWWSRFHGRLDEVGNLGLVYGHTHYLDWLEEPPDRGTTAGVPDSERGIRQLLRHHGSPIALYNVSSWVTTYGRRDKVVRATLLYIDEAGPLFLGWNWESHEPFHIPFEFVAKRRRGRGLDVAERQEAADLGWPSQLIDKWQIPEGI